ATPSASRASGFCQYCTTAIFSGTFSKVVSPKLCLMVYFSAPEPDALELEESPAEFEPWGPVEQPARTVAAAAAAAVLRKVARDSITMCISSVLWGPAPLSFILGIPKHPTTLRGAQHPLQPTEANFATFLCAY